MNNLRLPDEPKARRRGAMWGVVSGAIAGAAAMFVLDPQQGRRRRSLVRDKLIRFRNRADQVITEDLPSRVNYYAGFAQGAKHELAGAFKGAENPTPNEQVLVDRVLSSVFRDPELPRGSVNIDASGGTVFLRGSVDDEKLRDEIESRVRRVDGVADVVNLINEPEADPSNVR